MTVVTTSLPAPATPESVVPGRDKIPLTDKLDPTDTGVMRLQFRQIQRCTVRDV